MITIEPPPAIYACSVSIYLVHCSTVLFCQHIPCAGPFRDVTFYVADFSDEELGALGRCRALSYAVGVDGLTLSSKSSAVILFRWP